MSYVFVIQSASTSHKGKPVAVYGGDVWDASDPFVKARPDLFSSTPVKVQSSVGPVEQATAAPGEKRAAKPTKKSAKS